MRPERRGLGVELPKINVGALRGTLTPALKSTGTWIRGHKLVTAILAVAVIGAGVYINKDDAPAPPAGIDTSTQATAAAQTIEPSKAVEMYIPSIDLVANFEDGSCRVKDGAINPDTMDLACTYTADDKPYSLPGSDAPDLTVIAGHTGAGVSAAFNNLYDGSDNQHKVAVGDKLFLRTENSGEQWLVYKATDLHDPQKGDLAGDSSIWGTGATPGRLLTISCIQPANLLESAVRNAVVGWQYEGVAEASQAAAPTDAAPDGSTDAS